ncbi:MAG: Peptidylprolyl isomerase [Chloroflexi bacterium]|nr:Peptidylprolyl isomerase [Chloroflexota bacterium]
MSSPAEPRQGQPVAGNKQSQRQPRRRQPQQQYRRASAIIDDRPDGKPIIFGYGRHMTKREKDQAKRLVAYTSLAVVVAASVVVLVVAAVFQQFIYPNQTVATINGKAISRHDRDLMTGYYTAALAAQGGTTSQDPQALAVTQLQRQALTADQAKAKFGMTVSAAEADAQLNKSLTGSAALANFNNFLGTTKLSRDEYKRLIVQPQVLRTKLGQLLAKNAPKTAEEWHYARIQVASQKTAQSLLTQISGTTSTSHNAPNPETTFAKLAKSKSTDTQTASAGGDLGWERPADTSVDTLLPQIVPILRSMQQSHTAFKVYNTGSTWYILNFRGYDKKHTVTASQIQMDQTSAFNNWYNPIAAKAVANPPFAQNPLTSTAAPTPAQTQSQPITIQPTAVPATSSKSGKKK